MHHRIHDALIPSARWLGGTIIVLIFLLGAWPASGETAATGQASRPCLQAGHILNLAQYIASTDGAPDAYAGVAKAALGSAPGQAIHMTAYEENPTFVYAVAPMQSNDGAAADAQSAGKAQNWVRRLIVLNASTFIVDDQVLAPVSPGMNAGCLSSLAAPQTSGREAHVVEAAGQISAQILYPDKAAYQVRPIGQGQTPEGYRLEIPARELPPGARFLQILHVSQDATAGGALQSELTTAANNWNLNVTTGDRIFHLTLPPPAEGAGEINITTLNGRTVVAGRPLPSGILPHGPRGTRLLERWDSAYRTEEAAPWDIGRPADELQKVISAGKISKCRAVDLCCGSGTDAIYLASQGFDVTGIDISPTALGQAEQKARKANLSVHWVLADTLSPPDLRPFDFIYDRACYHVVREQNQVAYIETVRRLSHPGTSFLLISARKDDPLADGNWGVTEEDLRSDFLNLFDVEWMHEISLETSRPGFSPPAWSVFLKRKTGN